MSVSYAPSFVEALFEKRDATALHTLISVRARQSPLAVGVNRVTVGTGNSSLQQLAFYQKCGFRVVGVIRGYFDDYPPQIIEGGIVCRDMIRLAIDLESVNQAHSNTYAALTHVSLIFNR